MDLLFLLIYLGFSVSFLSIQYIPSQGEIPLWLGGSLTPHGAFLNQSPIRWVVFVTWAVIIGSFQLFARTFYPDILINVGVKQGCPLSMLLFLLAINPVLEVIEEVENKCYMIDGLTTSILAYADDLALVCERESDLQPILDAAVSIATWAGLKFRPNKCATLTLPGTGMTEYQIYGVTIPKIREEEAYKYLGVLIGLENDQTPYPILIKIFSDS